MIDRWMIEKALHSCIGCDPLRIIEREIDTEDSPRYRVLDEYVDYWYGSATQDEIDDTQARGLTMDDILTLAREWDQDGDAEQKFRELMEQVEEV